MYLSGGGAFLPRPPLSPDPPLPPPLPILIGFSRECWVGGGGFILGILPSPSPPPPPLSLLQGSATRTDVGAQCWPPDVAARFWPICVHPPTRSPSFWPNWKRSCVGFECPVGRMHYGHPIFFLLLLFFFPLESPLSLCPRPCPQVSHAFCRRLPASHSPLPASGVF